MEQKNKNTNNNEDEEVANADKKFAVSFNHSTAEFYQGHILKNKSGKVERMLFPQYANINYSF